MKHIHVIKHNEHESRRWIVRGAMLKIIDGCIEAGTLGHIRSTFWLDAAKKRMKKML